MKTKSTSTNKELNAKVKDVEKRQKELASAEKLLATDIVDELKKLVNSSPHIEAIRWQQYTPGFNDGDPCTFSISELEVKFDENVIAEYGNQEKTTLKKVSDEDEEDEDGPEDDRAGFISDYEVEDFLKKKMDVLNHKELGVLEKQYETLCKLHNSLTSMESELERRFGDGMQITVTKKGIETEDYDCGY
jgi:hypothetical protein